MPSTIHSISSGRYDPPPNSSSTLMGGTARGNAVNGGRPVKRVPVRVEPGQKDAVGERLRVHVGKRFFINVEVSALL
jgi:hypothetical protein